MGIIHREDRKPLNPFIGELSPKAKEWLDVILAQAEEITDRVRKLHLDLVRCRDDIGDEFWNLAPTLAEELGLQTATVVCYESIARTAVEGGYFDTAPTMGHLAAVTISHLTPKDRKGILFLARKQRWSVSLTRAEAQRLIALREGRELPEKAGVEPRGARGYVIIHPEPNGEYTIEFKGGAVEFTCRTPAINFTRQ